MSQRGFLSRFFWRAALGDHAYKFLFQRGPGDEVVSIDCETTGLDPGRDEIVAVAAVRIRGNRILISERFEALVRPEDHAPTATSIKVHGLRQRDIASALPMRRILPDLLRFIGGRPLIGYYIDFDIKMLDKYVLDLIETKLPNPRVEISKLYYDRKYGNAPPGTPFDLRFASIMKDLAIPTLSEHDALNDAVMAGMAYLVLRDMHERGTRIRRERTGHGPPPTGA